MDAPAEPACPIACAAAWMGDAWRLLILREVARGEFRFDGLRRALGIAPNILTRRLAGLVEDGLLARHRYSERPPRDEFRLTEKGQALIPILIALGAWARRFGDDTPMIVLAGADGVAFDPVVIDRATGRPLLAD
ncbi:winged helix-turn-helix transcriptional regulator [Sphingomonas morindae]|uniref:Helix-turn-helix transcriptional regulator n=1 Tax=Sphingomonas morindae TaxID=1541170 RepID=A0ABY4XAF3_9SPHN|nr:helix-turn-helix domain-containing protein [Sphingomonas morindae]USI73804.1 helix-turn-helix transcriptional regulator [Sphingomonas morindae]